MLATPGFIICPAQEKEIRQLTEDDTHVGWLLRNGQINEHEARTHPRRNVLQKALGGGNQFVDPQVGAVACRTRRLFSALLGRPDRGLYDNHLAEHFARLGQGRESTRRNAWWNRR